MRTMSPINEILTKMRNHPSPQLSARSLRQCPSSRISQESNNQFQIEFMIEMEEKRKMLLCFKQLIKNITEKLLELDAVTNQLYQFENSINSLLKNLKLIKTSIKDILEKENIEQKCSINDIKQSLKEMKENINKKEFNGVNELKSQNYDLSLNIQKCQDHLKHINEILDKHKPQIEIDNICSLIEQRLQQLNYIKQSPYFKEV